MDIGKRITELRKKHVMTQEQLAEALSTTRQAVSKWESSKSTPDVEYVIRMGKLFSVSMDYILLGEGEQSVHPAPTVDIEGNRCHRPKRMRIVFACLLILGVVLLCLLPLFASLYQSQFMKIHAPYYSDANEYLSEWPLLGVVIVSYIPFIIGLAGLLWPWLKSLVKTLKEKW